MENADIIVWPRLNDMIKDLSNIRLFSLCWRTFLDLFFHFIWYANI